MYIEEAHIQSLQYTAGAHYLKCNTGGNSKFIVIKYTQTSLIL
jgi:hypothetical protein